MEVNPENPYNYPTPEPAMQDISCNVFDSVFTDTTCPSGLGIRTSGASYAGYSSAVSTLPYGVTFTHGSQPLPEDYPSDCEWRVATAIYYAIFGYNKMNMRILDAQKAKSLYTRNEQSSKPEWVTTAEDEGMAGFGFHVYNPLFTYIQRQVGEIANQKIYLEVDVTNAAAKSRYAEHVKQSSIRYLMAFMEPDFYEDIQRSGNAPPTEGLTEAVAQYGGFNNFVNSSYRDIYASIAKKNIEWWRKDNMYDALRPSWFKECLLTNIATMVPSIDPVTYKVNHGFKYNSEAQILDLSAKSDFLKDMQFYIDFDYMPANEILRLYPHVNREQLSKITSDMQRYNGSAPFGMPFLKYQDGVNYFLIVKARWIWTEDAELAFAEKTDKLNTTGDFIYVRPTKNKDGSQNKTGRVNIEGGELHVSIKKREDGTEYVDIISEFNAPPHPPQKGEVAPQGWREIPVGDYVIPKYAKERFLILMPDQQLEFLRTRLDQGQDYPIKFRREQVYYTVLIPYHFCDASAPNANPNAKAILRKGKDGIPSDEKIDDMWDESRYYDQRDKDLVPKLNNIRGAVKKRAQFSSDPFSFYGFYELEGGILPNQVRSVDCFAKADLGVRAFVFGNSVSAYLPNMLSRVSSLFNMLNHAIFKWNNLINEIKSDVLVVNEGIVPVDASKKEPAIKTFTSRINKNRLIIIPNSMASLFSDTESIRDLVTKVSFGLPAGANEIFNSILQYKQFIEEELSAVDRFGQYETDTVANMNAQNINLAHIEIRNGFRVFEKMGLSLVANMIPIAAEKQRAAAQNNPNTKKAYETHLSIVGDFTEMMYMDGATLQDYAITVDVGVGDSALMQGVLNVANQRFASGNWGEEEYLTVIKAKDPETALERVKEISQRKAQEEQQRQMELMKAQQEAENQRQTQLLEHEKMLHDSKLSGDMALEQMSGDINLKNSQENANFQMLSSLTAQRQKLEADLAKLNLEIAGKMEIEKEKNKNTKKKTK